MHSPTSQWSGFAVCLSRCLFPIGSGTLATAITDFEGGFALVGGIYTEGDERRLSRTVFDTLLSIFASKSGRTSRLVWPIP